MDRWTGPFRRAANLALMAALAPSGTAGAAPPVAAGVAIRRSAGPNKVDGDLSDAGWKGAARIDSFYETSPGDNITPATATAVLLAFDAMYLYVGVICSDPEPAKIHAPYVGRDEISDSDDHVTLFLDTRGDRRSATEIRVDPRGQQADGTFEDANGNEDLSPDLDFDSAARIGPDGWTAEVRIPFSSLRYDPAGASEWGILVERNLPRNFRYTIFSFPVPRNSNCLVCRAAPLNGLSDLPRGGHLVAAPYATLAESAAPRGPAPAPLVNRPARGNGGLDLKWTPSPGLAIDGALNPDFSQVESDVGQISVNSRFALLYPEKRPFFLEGVDLFPTPIPAISTRTVTSPRWGLRATGKSEGVSYTMLAAEDRGGGTVVIPGPTGSVLAPQEGSSLVAIGRARKDFGSSFAGLLATDRESSDSSGGGHNRVLGADFQLSDGGHERVTGQLLVSDTRTPQRPDLYGGWDGRRFSSRALSVEWSHNDPGWHLRAIHQDVGDGFRADDGFVPQAGYRHEKIVAARNVYDLGALSRLQGGIYCDYFARPSGALIQRQCGFYASPEGARNLGGEIDLTLAEKDRLGSRVVDSRWLLQVYGLSIDPGKVLSRVSVSGFLGDSPDVVNARPGRGGEASLTATVKPALHLQLDFTGDRQWLDVDSEGSRGRLFTAQIARLKATYNFSARFFARAIGQYFSADRNPSLYDTHVSARESSFSGSALLSYRWNGQTVAFLGYGDEREGDAFGRLRPSGRSFFLKVSYAFRL